MNPYIKDTIPIDNSPSPSSKQFATIRDIELLAEIAYTVETITDYKEPSPKLGPYGRTGNYDLERENDIPFQPTSSAKTFTENLVYTIYDPNISSWLESIDHYLESESRGSEKLRNQVVQRILNSKSPKLLLGVFTARAATSPNPDSVTLAADIVKEFSPLTNQLISSLKNSSLIQDIIAIISAAIAASSVPVNVKIDYIRTLEDSYFTSYSIIQSYGYIAYYDRSELAINQLQTIIRTTDDHFLKQSALSQIEEARRQYRS